MPIHHVDVHELGALDRGELGGHVDEVGRENRRGDLDVGCFGCFGCIVHGWGLQLDGGGEGLIFG